MEYKVLASLYNELSQGCVWVSDFKGASRSIVKIKVKEKDNGKFIYCECLSIDENFRSRYNDPPKNDLPKRVHIDENQSVIIVNGWYRDKLGGIKTKNCYELEIEYKEGWRGKLWAICANLDHPQVVVRLTTCIALLSLLLGAIGLALGIFSMIIS